MPPPWCSSVVVDVDSMLHVFESRLIRCGSDEMHSDRTCAIVRERHERGVGFWGAWRKGLWGWAAHEYHGNVNVVDLRILSVFLD